MHFTVRHIPAGAASVVQEAASGASPDEVRSRFAAGGVVLSVAQASAERAAASQRFDVGWWCEELRTLLRSGMTVVVVTHNEELGRRARRVLRLRDGRVEYEERR